MKIFFVRHGEGIDDVENRYGGWADLGLSPAGIEGARRTGFKLKKKGVKVDLILSSPLKRAVQTAEGIAKILKVPVVTFVYLKERNTYGLLSGENKDEAKRKYPDLVEAYERGKEVLGYEDYDFFLKRVRVLVKKLASFKNKTLICVTHGKLLGALFEDILKVEVKKFHDNCIAEVEIDNQEKLVLLNIHRIDLVLPAI